MSDLLALVANTIFHIQSDWLVLDIFDPSNVTDASFLGAIFQPSHVNRPWDRVEPGKLTFY